MRQAASHIHSQMLDALRGRGRSASAWQLVLMSILCSAAYGAVMGSFGMFYGGSKWQVPYAAMKSPMLLGITFGLTLPSFIVINLLFGLGRDLRDVLHAMLSTQVAVSITLLSLAPLTLVWYLSVPRYESAILFNAAMFCTASVAAQRPLKARYRPLLERNPLHGKLLRVWIFVYAFVGIQMGWVMRPFIGQPGKPVEFLRPEKWDNAYVIVSRMVWRALFS